MPAGDIDQQAGEDEQRRQLCHTLHRIQHGTDLQGMQQPEAGHQQRQPALSGTIGAAARIRRGKTQRQQEHQHARQQVQQHIGRLPVPQVRTLQHPIGQERGHRHRAAEMPPFGGDLVCQPVPPCIGVQRHERQQDGFVVEQRRPAQSRRVDQGRDRKQDGQASDKPPWRA